MDNEKNILLYFFKNSLIHFIVKTRLTSVFTEKKSKCKKRDEAKFYP